MSTEKHDSPTLPIYGLASRQNHFLRILIPSLQSIPWLSAIWLGGSAGRGDGDRWSSVDLYLHINSERALPLVSEQTNRLLDESFPDGWTSFGLQSGIQTIWLEGLTHAHLPDAANRGGVYFRLEWTVSDQLVAQATDGHAHLLWTRHEVSTSLPARGTMPPQQKKFVAERVQTDLAQFWRHLSRLPAVINRDEHLAAAALLQQVRTTLTDLVVRLNGVTRPDTPAQFNRFLGPAQQEAFEKTLRQSNSLAESWIGQAVALIVLYRWYAPQLVEIHNLTYPTQLEETVLALLSSEVSGWPARITTA